MGREKLYGIAAISKKTFDKIPDEEKKELILDELEQIENDKNFQEIKKMWDALDDDKKMKYYRNGEIISVKGSVKWTTKGGISFAAFPLNLLIKDCRYEAFAPAMRLCVNVGLLDAPNQLGKEELAKNIMRDAKSLSRNLKIFGIISEFIPQLKVAAKIVTIILPYANWYKKHGAPLMQDRTRKKIEEKTEKTIAEAFSDSQNSGEGSESQESVQEGNVPESKD